MRKIPRIKRPRRNIKIRTAASEAREAKRTSSKPTQRRPIITTDGLMNEVAAAQYIGKEIRTLQNWRSMGKRPPDHVKRGRNVFYEKSALDEYLATKQKR